MFLWTLAGWLVGVGFGACAVPLVRRLTEKRPPLVPGERYLLPSGDPVEILRVWLDGDVWFRKLDDPPGYRVMSDRTARQMLRPLWLETAVQSDIRPRRGPRCAG